MGVGLARLNYMKLCPKCEGELKLILAGVSKKSGKPYPAFYSCKNYACDFTERASQSDSPAQLERTDEAMELLKRIDKNVKELLEDKLL